MVGEGEQVQGLQHQGQEGVAEEGGGGGPGEVNKVLDARLGIAEDVDDLFDPGGSQLSDCFHSYSCSWWI